MPKQRLDDRLILEAIDWGLNVIGESPKKALLFRLENELGFEWKDIPENIDAFEGALKQVFGVGYKYFDSLFCKYIQDSISKDLSGTESFAECVHKFR